MTNRPREDFADNVEQTLDSLVPVQSIKGVDITPVIMELIEYAKDHARVGNLESIISSVPAKSRRARTSL